MVPPKKYSAAAATMSNGSTKMGKFGGSGDMSSSSSYQKKESGDVRKENRSQQNSSGSSFRTDQAISGNRTNNRPGAPRERELERWVPDDAPSQDLSLDSMGSANGNRGGWDQFAVNEQKFGLKTDYDPNIYTTEINTQDPNYKKRVERAERIAREIEGSSANNSHVAEERVTDNFAGAAGEDEEDRYSGVRRQQQDFPPLASANRSNKYTTPARRAPTGQSTVSGAPVDPAIISSQLARPDKLPMMDKNRSTSTSGQAQTSQKADASISRPESPATNTAAKTEIKATSTPAIKTGPAPAVSGPKKIEVPASLASPMSATSNAAGSTAPPNATATIERDLNNSFKSFATQQRTQIGQQRSQKAKQDKMAKLTDLKKFSMTFKLRSPVPEDLISILAKDPAKQHELMERAKREKEAALDNTKQAKIEASAKVIAPIAPSSDLKTSKPSAPHAAPATNVVPGRQNAGRAPGFAPQGPYPPPNRNQQSQMNANQHGRQNGAMNSKMRGGGAENKFMGQQPPPIFDQRLSVGGQARLPPTGPSMPNGDSRRASGVGNQFTAAKLNPSITEFKPTFGAANFGTAANAGPSPRAVVPVMKPTPAPFLRRKLRLISERPRFSNDSNTMSKMKKVVPTNGKDYKFNGGIAAPFETAPVFRSEPPTDVAPEKKMVESFSKVFEAAAAALPLSPIQPSHVTPTVPHQHQLPFHLQHGAHAPGHGIPPRPSPRQTQAMHMPQHPYQHGQPVHFNGHDDHRMVPSHSAQSFQSPRLGNAPMAYPSPMTQNAQIAYQPQQSNMQYPMGPGVQAPNLNRSFSGNGPQPFFQGAPVMNGQVMMQAPPNNGFMGPQGMVGPGQQMPMHGGPPQFFVPQGGGPPMPGANGYPSPGRGGTMMMNQGSQQGQPGVYGLSPAMSFQQPVPGQYQQQPPGPMNNMRSGGYNGGPPNYGTNPPQMYPPYQHNRGPGNNYNNGNKNYHPQQQQQQQGPHTLAHAPAQQHQVPTGPQGRPAEGGDEAK